MIDTHSHLNLKQFDRDYQAVANSSFAQGIKAIINVGADLQTSLKACQIAEEYSGQNIFATIGLHPTEAAHEILAIDDYGSLAKRYEPVVKAIGEVGLDFFHCSNLQEQEKQKKVFIEFINLAKKLKLPLALHFRGDRSNPFRVYQEAFDVLCQENYFFGVVHCFAAPWSVAEKFLEKGFYFGLNGIITFPSFRETEMAQRMPLERIVLETDCPYLAPQEKRSERNEPKNIIYIARKLAEIKNENVEKIIAQTDLNAQQLFNFSVNRA